jgi:hypothetical protein
MNENVEKVMLPFYEDGAEDSPFAPSTDGALALAVCHIIRTRTAMRIGTSEVATRRLPARGSMACRAIKVAVCGQATVSSAAQNPHSGTSRKTKRAANPASAVKCAMSGRR